RRPDGVTGRARQGGDARGRPPAGRRRRRGRGDRRRRAHGARGRARGGSRPSQPSRRPRPGAVTGLPRQSIAAVTEPSRKTSKNPAIIAGPRGSAMARILVIEDEKDIQDVLEYNLRQAGHKVNLASTGLDGLKLAREKKPDLVLLDLMLPDISGTEVCKALKQDSVTRDVQV